MKRDFATLFLWGAFLAGLTAAQLVFFAEAYSYALLGGAALVVFLTGLYVLSFRSREPSTRSVPDSSYATLALGAGAAIAVVGSAFGPWLWLPGLGLAAVGLAGLVRELRAERGAGR